MAVGGRIRAAGGLIYRPGPAGLAEITVVHRPRYDDWSWPKGKLDGDESFEEAALREVEEETGLVCRLVRPYGWTSYLDRKGREKLVRYWLMEPTDGTFRPSDEVDRLRWLTVEEALGVLTYERDRALLRENPLD
jgi:8-oxo-dGTP pyrophosphatase MutT (NUDIX family)